MPRGLLIWFKNTVDNTFKGLTPASANQLGGTPLQDCETVFDFLNDNFNVFLGEELVDSVISTLSRYIKAVVEYPTINRI